MLIAVVGVDAPGALARVLANGARAAGHTSTVVDARRLVSGWAPLRVARRVGADGPLATRLVARLGQELGALDPDVVVVTKGRFLGARAVRGLKKRVRGPILSYYPDHPLWPGFYEKEIVQALHEYDEVVVWGEHVREALAAVGIQRVRVVPFAYDPELYFPPPAPVPLRWEAAMLGQAYPVRVPYVRALADRRLLVSGLGWPAALPGTGAEGATYRADATREAYWQSGVAFNILHECNVPAHNMRTFEIPASGAVMVATRTPEHERLFGEEGAVLVDSPSEARERVLALLGEPERRRAIADEGRRRVEGQTYGRRMQEILEPWT